MSAPLQKGEQHNLHIIANGKRRCRWVEANIDFYDTRFEVFIESWRRIVDKAAPCKFGKKVVVGQNVVKLYDETGYYIRRSEGKRFLKAVWVQN